MSSKIDFAKLPNPYDFSNPITDPVLFGGRSKEIKEIEYYLGHAVGASRPINLAILGPRASGKTSVLNMIECEARKKEFCVARVDLDEGDVSAQLPFFYKIFDSILFSACSKNAYEGLTGKTYETYRNMVDAFEIPEDKTFCPFFFPVQYGKAMSKGNIQAALSDVAFKQDLTNIRKLVNCPIAVLFDEGDVLIKSRVHLEKLRNIFMATPGFMVVLAGTPALFPLMDEVFSPIVRQFKKINLDAFSEEEETRDCIKKPLEKMGIPVPGEIFDHETYHDMEEIHKLSGGRPYEIQLICHFLFRRIQEGRATQMELTVDILDDVRKELETSQDVSIRPILNAIKNFGKRRMEALELLCSCNGRASFEQIWFTEYVLWGEKNWTEQLLRDELDVMRQEGVVTLENNNIKFSGDEFDRIYCKYLARKHDVLLGIADIPFEIHLTVAVDVFVKRRIKRVTLHREIHEGPTGKPKVQELATMLASPDGLEDPFKENRALAEFLYWASLDSQGNETFPVAVLTIETPWTMIWRVYREQKDASTKSLPLSGLEVAFKPCSERANELKGKAYVEMLNLPVATLDALEKKVLQSSNLKLKADLQNEHQEKMFVLYTEHGNVERSIFHAELGYRLKPSATLANNLGYLHMKSDNLEKAKEMLDLALSINDEKSDHMALILYNLGIINLKQMKINEALDQFRAAAAAKEIVIACVLVPVVDANTKTLSFKEVNTLSLKEPIKNAIEAINELTAT